MKFGNLSIHKFTDFKFRVIATQRRQFPSPPRHCYIFAFLVFVVSTAYICVTRVSFTFVFLFNRNFEILILRNPGRDRLVIAATVSSSNQLEPGSDLIRALYFEECVTCQLCSIKLCATR